MLYNSVRSHPSALTVSASSAVQLRGQISEYTAVQFEFPGYGKQQVLLLSFFCFSSRRDWFAWFPNHLKSCKADSSWKRLSVWTPCQALCLLTAAHRCCSFYQQWQQGKVLWSCDLSVIGIPYGVCCQYEWIRNKLDIFSLFVRLSFICQLIVGFFMLWVVG